MARRLLAVLVLSFVLPSAALAATVHVRVEGKTKTIWGPAEPTLTATTALDTLEAASLAGEFYYHLTKTSFGPYVDQVGRFPAETNTGWVFKVNGVSPPVGADQVQLKDGDRVLWYWAQFGVAAGGPPTLDLKAAPGGCYTAVAQDDNGKPVAVAGLVLQVGSKRTVPVKSGKACPGPHRGLLVRATAPTAVRSIALK